MTRKRYTAEKIDYIFSWVAKRDEWDYKGYFVAVYVPELKVFVNAEDSPIELDLPIDVYFGNKAERKYQTLKRKIGGRASPQTVKVSSRFIDWCRAYHLVENPEKSIVDLLTPKEIDAIIGEKD